MCEMICVPQFMKTALPCVASNILDFSVGDQLLYSIVWWDLKNKDWSLLCILSWSLSFQQIYLTKTSWRIVHQRHWVTAISQCLWHSPNLAEWLEACSPSWFRTLHGVAHKYKGVIHLLSFKKQKVGLYLLTLDTKWPCNVSRGFKDL